MSYGLRHLLRNMHCLVLFVFERGVLRRSKGQT